MERLIATLQPLSAPPYFSLDVHVPMAKIVVPGGNGFIGSEICRVAAQNGHQVAAFGRTGRPALTPARHPWVQDVEWRAADVFEPDTWRDLLDGADAVIHSIATIKEDPAAGVTFDRVNAESALIAAEEAAQADAEAFVYLSVRDKPPFVSEDFLAAKRRAEREIPRQFPDLRTVSLRPNLVYGPRRWGSTTIAAVFNHLPGDVMGSFASRDERPLPVELVAAAAVQAATTPTLEGPLLIPEIADIGRTSGLVDLDELSEPSLAPLFAGLGGTALGFWLLRRWWS